MANLREVKLFENEFEKTQNESEISDLNVDFSNSNEFVKIDSSKFNSDNFSKTFFENNLNSKLYFSMDKNAQLKISGSGILYLKIEEDINLELIFTDINFSNVIIKILVNKNKKLNLIDYSNSKNLYKNIEIILEEGAILNISQFILNSKINHSIIKLEKNSVYELNSVYFGEEIKNYILNKVIHQDINSSSNLNINGIGSTNSKIINDAMVVINSIATRSKSFQKMYNLLLTKNAQIQSEPILEVKNSGIECSHASSISQISDDILFYLSSRGISKEDSIKLIIDSFYNQVIFSILDESLQKKYSKILAIN